jgi:hypothetical protein
MTTVISKPGTSFLLVEQSDIMPNGDSAALSAGAVVTVIRTVATGGTFSGKLYVASPLAADLKGAIANGVVMTTIAARTSAGVPSAAGMVKWSSADVVANADGSGTAITAGLALMTSTAGRLVAATTTNRIVAYALEATTSATAQIRVIFQGKGAGFGTLP